MPRTDLAMTFTRGDEIIASERFVEMVREHELTGIDFDPVYGAGKNGQPLNFYQIRPLHYLDKHLYPFTPIHPSALDTESSLKVPASERHLKILGYACF